AQAALAAKNNARAATLTYATGQEPNFSSYRRPRIDPTANTDKTLSILQAKDSSGNVLGTLVQYAAHPTAIGESDGGAFGGAVARGASHHRDPARHQSAVRSRGHVRLAVEVLRLQPGADVEHPGARAGNRAAADQPAGNDADGAHDGVAADARRRGERPRDR